MEYLNTFIVPVIVGLCLVVGYLIKHITGADNRFIRLPVEWCPLLLLPISYSPPSMSAIPGRELPKRNSPFGTPEGTRHTMVSPPSSRRRSTAHRAVELNCSSPTHKSKTGYPEWDNPFLVRRKGLEPPTLGTGIRCSIH